MNKTIKSNDHNHFFFKENCCLIEISLYLSSEIMNMRIIVCLIVIWSIHCILSSLLCLPAKMISSNLIQNLIVYLHQVVSRAWSALPWTTGNRTPAWDSNLWPRRIRVRWDTPPTSPSSVVTDAGLMWEGLSPIDNRSLSDPSVVT